MFNKISWFMIAIIFTATVGVGTYSYIKINKITADIASKPSEDSVNTGLIDYNNGQEASALSKGLLSSTDWTRFNNKQDTLVFNTDDFIVTDGSVRIDHSNDSIGSTNSTNSTASALSNGLLVAGDWITFNNKLSTETDPIWNADKSSYSAKTVADLLYLGIGADAANSLKLGGELPSYYYPASNPNGYVSSFSAETDPIAMEYLNQGVKTTSSPSFTGLSIGNLSGILIGTAGTVSAITNNSTNWDAASSASHAALTIGTANGLSLSTQQLSLALSSAGTTGALSTGDWTTFSSKGDYLFGSNNFSGTGNFTTTSTGTYGSLSVGAVQLIHNSTTTYYRQASDTNAARGTALAAAFSASVAGDTMVIGPGNYSISATLNVLANQNIVLQGANITSSANTFNTFSATAVSGWSISGRGVLAGAGSASGGAYTDEAGIYISGTHGDYRIEGITFTNYRGAGITDAGATAGAVKEISGIISNCYIHANNYGIYLGANVEYANISNNQILSNNNYGIYFDGGNITVDNNEITKNASGIYVGSASANHAHGIISNNKITHSTTYGIYCNAITKGENIIGNEILVQPTGIYLNSTTGVNIGGGAIYPGSGSSGYTVYMGGTPGGYNYVSGVYFGLDPVTAYTGGTTSALSYLIFNKGSFTAVAKDYNYVEDSITAPLNVTNGLSQSIIRTGLRGNTGLIIKGTSSSGTPELLPNDPTISSSLQLWFKADAITASDGDAVPTWNDSSGNSRNATQATPAKQPIYKSGVLNGKPVVRFNTTSDTSLGTAAVTLTQPYTIFMVAINNGDVSAFATPLSLEKTAGVTGALNYTGASGTTANLYAGANLPYTLNPAAWNIYDTVFSGATSKVAINGATDVTGNAGTNNVGSYVTIGRHRLSYSGPGYGWNGDISEVIVYSGELTKVQREGIAEYLSEKYAITITPGVSGGSSLPQTANLQEWQDSNGTTLASVGPTGTGMFDKIGIGIADPTAYLHLKAGTATASTAPLKLTTGTLLATEEAGAIEFLTDTFYMTATNGVAGSTKRQAIPGATTGTAPPATTPIRVGDIYTDTNNKKVYISTGTASSADWTILN